MGSDPLLLAAGLSRSFGNKHVLHNLSFGLNRGDSVALLGANGAGKTTLLRVLATLVLPSSGEVWLDNISLERKSWQARARIGWAPATDGGFVPRFTGRENLDLFAGLYRVPPLSVQKFLKEWGAWKPLAAALDTPFYLCSVGMRQALQIARSLIHDPDLLLWDEPFRSLAPEAKRELQEMLKPILKNKALLFATHSPEEARAWAKQSWSLQEGKLHVPSA